MYDVIVIGGGPAAMSAGIYLARKKMKIVLVSPEFGGQTAKSSEVENYLGFTKLSGPELTAKFIEHASEIGVEMKTGEVDKLDKKDSIFEVAFKTETLQAKSIIIASGKTPRGLGIPGEKEFKGKGVSYCAICDGPLFRDKVVAVVGGGNSALDAALEMAHYAGKVYILNLNAEFQGETVRIDRVKESKNVEILSEVETREIKGEQFVKALKYKESKTGQEKEIACDGIFVEIGWVPATEFVAELVELNNLKEIIVDKENKTSCKGIYAAGDVTDVMEKQIIIAAGEGAKAALNAWKYVIIHK